jgi:ABC-type enterobactin transport system permease subunit
VGEHIAEATDEKSGNLVSNNPNATVALGSGSGVGAVVIWIAQAGGANIPPEIAAVIGGGIAAVALFIGRNGLIGGFRRIVRGPKEA